MVGADLIIVWINLAGALFACGVNALSAWSSPRDWRGLRVSVASLAAVYVIGYVLLLTGALDFESWSRVFRAISPFAWVLVWAGPPLQAARMWQVFDDVVKALKGE